jgi:hypothetical protein
VQLSREGCRHFGLYVDIARGNDYLIGPNID